VLRNAIEHPAITKKNIGYVHYSAGLQQAPTQYQHVLMTLIREPIMALQISQCVTIDHNRIA
jgi:hypothetical protein